MNGFDMVLLMEVNNTADETVEQDQTTYPQPDLALHSAQNKSLVEQGRVRKVNNLVSV